MRKLPMKMQVRNSGKVTILDLQEQLTFSGQRVAAFEKKIEELMQAGQVDILLNLAEVGHMDSAGIGAIVNAYTNAGKQGGQVKLLHLTPRLQQLLQMVGLTKVLEDFDDESQALASFEDSPGPAT